MKSKYRLEEMLLELATRMREERPGIVDAAVFWLGDISREKDRSAKVFTYALIYFLPVACIHT